MISIGVNAAKTLTKQQIIPNISVGKSFAEKYESKQKMIRVIASLI